MTFNKTTPLVSVLMTSFNREKYIAEAIESVLASTFKDFELIIVDDCSKDNTVEIARKYEALDSRLKVCINEVNLGDYPNRNKAASYARGKYLKYLDSDDTMNPNCLEIMVTEMEKHANCAFGVISTSLKKTEIHYPDESYKVHFFQRGILDISPSGSIIRTSIFREESGFWDLRCVSDFEFWLRLALKYPMLELERGLISWRQHEEQEIQLGHEEYLKHNLTILSQKIMLSKLSKTEQELILKKYKKSTMRFLVKSMFKLGVKKAISLKRINNLRLIDAI